MCHGIKFHKARSELHVCRDLVVFIITTDSSEAMKKSAFKICSTALVQRLLSVTRGQCTGVFSHRSRVVYLSTPGAMQRCQAVTRRKMTTKALIYYAPTKPSVKQIKGGGMSPHL